MNYDVDKSMDSLEEAVALDPDNFWAQFKYAELHYRLRVLNKAEEETRREALNSRAIRGSCRSPANSFRTSATLKQSCVRNVAVDEAADGAGARALVRRCCWPSLWS